MCGFTSLSPDRTCIHVLNINGSVTHERLHGDFSRGLQKTLVHNLLFKVVQPPPSLVIAVLMH